MGCLVLGMRCRERFFRRYQRFVYGTQLTSGLEVCTGKFVDEFLWRIVGHEMTRQLRCDETCRRRMHCQIAQHGLALMHAGL